MANKPTLHNFTKIPPETRSAALVPKKPHAASIKEVDVGHSLRKMLDGKTVKASKKVRLAGRNPAEKKLPSILSPEALLTNHRDILTRLINYRHRNYRNKVEMPNEVWDQMERRNAKYLYSNNLFARENFARRAELVLRPFFESRAEKVSWITISPGQFTTNSNDAMDFNPFKLQQWVRSVLPGMSFIGIVEAGCFPVPYASHSRIEVSFHVHLHAWGCTEDQVSELKRHINRRWPSAIPGVPPMYSRQVSAEEAVERLYYLSKAPVKDKRPSEEREIIDPETGEVKMRRYSNKGPIRTGHFARMCIAMQKQYIDRLAFSAGEGNNLLRNIVHPLLASHRSEVAARARRLGNSVRAR